MNKFSFVILLEYLNITLEDIKTFKLNVIENESDLNLGYITVEGENKSIKEFKSFINGSNFI